MNYKIILLGLVLLALVNGAAGYCTTIITHKDLTSEVGYRVCSDIEEPVTEYSSSSGRGVSGSGFSGTMKPNTQKPTTMTMSYEYEFSKYPNTAVAADRMEFDTLRDDDDVSDIVSGYMKIQSHNATYRTYTERYLDDTLVMSKTGELVYLDHYSYRHIGEVRFLVEPTMVFRMYLVLEGENDKQGDLVRIFESINLTNIAVTWEDPLEVANRLFEQGKYEEAIAGYDRIWGDHARSLVPTEYGQEACDKKGIALIKLGRYDEAVEWFSMRESPSSPETWKAYGELLAEMGFNAEAEYAFIQAEEVQKESDERIIESQKLQKLQEKWDSRTADQVLRDLENTTQTDDNYFSLIWELKEVDPSAALDPLIDMLLNESIDAKNRSFAAAALGDIKDPRAIDPLIQYLKEDDCGCRSDELYYVFQRIGEKSVEPLIALLNDEDPKLRKNAAYILGNMYDARAIEPLKSLLNSTDQNLRDAAETSLALIENSLKNGSC